MAKAMAMLDALMLLMEKDSTPQHVGMVLLFETPDGNSTKAAAELVAQYRQATPVSPFDCLPQTSMLALPQWLDASSIDLTWHVRSTSLEQPGSIDLLHRKIAELHRDVMDRSRPLFEIHVFDSVEGGRIALYVKIHRALADGPSCALRGIASLRGKPSKTAAPPLFAVDLTDEKPSPPANLLRKISSIPDFALRQGVALSGVLIQELWKNIGRFWGVSMPGSAPFTAPRTRFNDPLQAGRAFAGFTLPIDRLHDLGKAFDITLRDLALVIVDAGLSRYLADHGETPLRPLTAFCPNSGREPGDPEAPAKANAIIVPLGRPEASVKQRLHAIAANIATAKDEVRTMTKEAAMSYAALTFLVSEGLLTIDLASLSQPMANFALSIVTGPEDPLYLGRNKLAGLFPISMAAAGIGLHVTALSRANALDFGLLSNFSAVPDPDLIARHCLNAFDELTENHPLPT